MKSKCQPQPFSREARQMNSELVDPQLSRGDASVSTPTVPGRG
ncbi:hypothetical protein BZL30_5052 [Mycobacterium kansasii]|uniref:Uncharacterized protein n=1 Tax=Mycobacterium kansasii TaxID=1768 RepID=A0A1V3X361_MYCKA|nr:hypothetical protein BZL30_5052 [Mycobacterium kansasii]